MIPTAQRVALITGAGAGLGWATAQRLADDGMRVICLGRGENVVGRAAELRSRGKEADSEIVDVADAQAVKAGVKNILARHGRVDVLLNNAAQPGADLHIWEQTLDNWNATLAIDVTAAMLCTREVLNQSMLERRSGSIVNFSSSAGWNGIPRKSHYCVAKAGLRVLTKVTAQEVGPFGIRVNCLVPGAIDTELLRSYQARIAAEQGVTVERIREGAARSSSLRHISTPEEVAAVVRFLASDESRYITGQQIRVDAGSLLKFPNGPAG